MNFSKFKTLTRLEQTLFGLPVIVIAILLPLATKEVTPNFFTQVTFVILAFLAARISGMSFNQLIDWKIDAENPRTKNRVIPKGEVTPFQAGIVAWSALSIFILTAFFISHLVGMLSILAAAIIVSYSFMKRVHASCHFVLGTLHFLAPVMAWVAVTNHFSLIPISLGCTTFLAVVGTEIIYAMQDLDFDRTKGLHSIPVRLGIKNSLSLAKTLHVLTLFSATTFGVIAKLHWIYFFAPFSMALFFFYFHTRWQQKDRMFISNTFVSLSLFTFTLLALLCAL